MASGPDALQRALLRFVGVGLGLTAAAVPAQDRIVSDLLPLFRLWLDLIDHSFRTVDLSLVSDHAETMIRRLAVPLAGQDLGRPAVQGASVDLLFNQAAAGIVLQPQILAISLLFAWPWHSARELGLRILIGAVLLPVILLLDVPTMLYGLAWYEETKRLDPGHVSLLVSWADALNAGGRFAMAIVAAVAATAVAARLGRRGAVGQRSETVQDAATNRTPVHANGRSQDT